MKTRPAVAITGMGMITPAGMGISPLWQACLKKTPITHLGFGKVSPDLLAAAHDKVLSSPWIKNSADIKSKSLIMCLYSLIEALDEAQWKNFTEDDALIIGTTTGQIGLWENSFQTYAGGTPITEAESEIMRKQPCRTICDDIKKALDFPGRANVLVSACSASTQAIIHAEQLISSGRAKRVLAGGVEELSQLTMSGFGSLKLLDQTPCRPFDQNRMGINLSEGAAFYTVCEKSEKSLGFILGGDTFLDSYHMTSPNPAGMGLQKAIVSTLFRARVLSSEIEFIHAHGTGSSHNDRSESTALSALFPHHPPVISTKGVHGHALGASGAIEVGLCLHILNAGLIPPVTGLVTPDEGITLNLPQKVLTSKISTILKTTLGFGGINSALVLRGPHA